MTDLPLWTGDRQPDAIARRETGRISVAGSDTVLSVKKLGPSLWELRHDVLGTIARRETKKAALETAVVLLLSSVVVHHEVIAGFARTEACGREYGDDGKVGQA